MGAVDLTATMDGIGDLVEAAALVPNVYRWPAESVTVPCAVVGYPTAIDLDATFQRGTDRVALPLWLVVGRTTTKDARDALSVLLGAAPSVKATLDGAQSFGDLRVTDAEVSEIVIGGVSYLGLRFTVDVLT